MKDACDIEDKLSANLEYFGERLNRVFAHFFCKSEYADYIEQNDSLTIGRDWMVKTIQNACLPKSRRDA
ncbi:MAG TPA: hypothetical protein VHC95_02535 [Opitutales bacterium]|nr:hypothetical protein [Opitutales bacterium]